ncbi:hypothetical protein [Solirubrobacter soli]|uniref:hypothetical protein n=1 Tax=Solirubrobacter soli TaxID=363832 RepID=UPI0004166CC1|nr:hypothetical protein [Solirubrobacter soli]
MAAGRAAWQELLGSAGFVFFPAGATQNYAVGIEIGAFDALTLTAPAGSPAAGSAVTVDVPARDHGDALSGRLVRYAIAGANPQSGTVTTTGAGTSAISWSGVRPGTDALHAFLASRVRPKTGDAVLRLRVPAPRRRLRAPCASRSIPIGRRCGPCAGAAASRPR